MNGPETSRGRLMGLILTVYLSDITSGYRVVLAVRRDQKLQRLSVLDSQ